MESTLPKDKVILDLSDKEDRQLAELLSRMEPGDEIIGRIRIALDENADGLAILSIRQLDADQQIQSAKKKKRTKNTDVTDEPQSAALAVLGGGNEDDLPPESTPSGEPAARQAPSQPYEPDALVK